MSPDDVSLRVHRTGELPEGVRSPDVYFLPGYGQASSLAHGGEWVLLEAFDGAWQMPLVIRALSGGAKDAISPYGYSGIYASPSLSEEQVTRAWTATMGCLGDLGVISVLLRHSPLVPQAPGVPKLVSVVCGHPTIVLEPANSDAAWSGLASTCRTRIRKATKNGYTADIRTASSQDLSGFGDFRRLYEGTMNRLDAASQYFFGDDYYKTLLECLGPDLLIAEVRDSAGVPVSSALLMRHEDRLHYHLSGSSPEDARMGTNNLMLWTATQFTVEQGMTQFHLGGGLDGRDGLFHFKQTFGGRELGYDVSGLVIDHDLYQSHTEGRAKECGTEAEALLRSNYFPAYRGGTREDGP